MLTIPGRPRSLRGARAAASVSDTVSREAMAISLRKAFNDPTKVTNAFVDRKVDLSNIVGRDREGALAIDQSVRGKPERVLGHVRAPVLVFWGGASLSLSQDTADRFYAAVTRASHREKQVRPTAPPAPAAPPPAKR